MSLFRNQMDETAVCFIFAEPNKNKKDRHLATFYTNYTETKFSYFSSAEGPYIPGTGTSKALK